MGCGLPRALFSLALATALLLLACNPNRPNTGNGPAETTEIVSETLAAAREAYPKSADPERIVAALATAEVVPVVILHAEGGKTPMPSLSEAVAQAATGETILIPPGHHYGNFYLHRPITLRGVGASAEVVLQGLYESTVALLSDGARVENVHILPPLTQPDAEHIAVSLAAEVKWGWADRCLIRGGEEPAVYSYRGGLTLSRSYVFGTQDNTAVVAVDGDILMKSCVVTGNANRGMQVRNSNSSRVLDCEFSHNGNSGIAVVGGRCLIQGSRFHHNNPHALVVAEQGCAQVLDSLLTDSAEALVEVFQESLLVMVRSEVCSSENRGLQILEGSRVHLVETELRNLSSFAAHVTGGSRVTASGLDVVDTFGFQMTEYSQGRFTHCEFRENNIGALFFLYAAPVFEDCVFEDNVIAGVHTQGCAEPRFVRCRIANNRGHGMRSDHLGRGTFTECQIVDNGQHGVSMIDGAYPTFIDCEIGGNGLNGVRLAGGVHPAFQGCTISGNRGTGFVVGAEAYPTIEGGTVAGNHGYGIQVASQGRLFTQGVSMGVNSLGGSRIEPGGQSSGMGFLPFSKPNLGPPAAPPADPLHLTVDASDKGAFANLLDAIDASEPGAVITIRPGEYHGGHVLPHTVHLVGEGPREEIVLTNERGSILSTRGPGFSVRGVTLRQSGIGWLYWDSHGHETWHPCVSVHEARVALADCWIRAANGPGIRAEGTNAHVEVTESHFEDCHRGGIQVKDGASARIASTEVIDDGWTGVILQRAGRIDISDTHLSGHRWYGMWQEDTPDVSMVNVVMEDNGEGNMNEPPPATWEVEDGEM